MSLSSEPRYHVRTLNDVLERRKEKNNRYSLRAFAVHIGLHPSALSRILAGKQELSLLSAGDVINKLDLEREDKIRFALSVAAEKYDHALAKLGQDIGQNLFEESERLVGPYSSELQRPLEMVGSPHAQREEFQPLES